MQKPMRFDPPSRPCPVSGPSAVMTRIAYALTAFACLVGLSVATPVRVAAESDRISPNLVRQLKAVLQEKRSRTPTQQKIDPSLLVG